jgi:hypothetical protein
LFWLPVYLKFSAYKYLGNSALEFIPDESRFIPNEIFVLYTGLQPAGLEAKNIAIG